MTSLWPPAMAPYTPSGLVRSVRRVSAAALVRPAVAGRAGTSFILLIGIATLPAAAQTPGASFCSTQMAQTIKNLFTLIQYGGPLIGGVVGLGSTVMIGITKQPDKKKEYKQLRNQAVVYGVIIAPLGTAIVQFLLNNVVAGGASCGF